MVDPDPDDATTDVGVVLTARQDATSRYEGPYLTFTFFSFVHFVSVFTPFFPVVRDTPFSPVSS